MEGTNLPGLKPEDYHLGAGEKLNEAVSRSWTRLLSLWTAFRKAKAVLPAADLGTSLTRERWLLQLFQELGYGRLLAASPVEIDGKSYPVSHRWQGQYYQVPVHLVSFRADLDKRSEQKIQGANKASPHGIVQEFLNRTDVYLWAFVSNGLKLLVIRDNASLTRQAYVEFDLEGIFEGEAYADFRLFWLLCHQSRVEGTAEDRPETCWLELWSKQAQTDGRRALDQLRDGVQRALETLGTGFIAHKANQNLCARLRAGELNKNDLYRQLLRVVYRLIFIFVAEDRDLLHFPGASDEARSCYARFYSGQRLRRMAERTRGSRHADLWVALRLVFAKLGNGGCSELGLPPLGGFLFSPDTMPDLDSAELSNEHLLQAVRNLGLVKDRSGWRLVDYRNLGSEELGSVYESLLELNPVMEIGTGDFGAGKFSLSVAAGNQRKTSGSYYTPDSLVQCLLDSALDPVVDQAIQGKSPAAAEKAILALKVCDPAVGSGHFLVGAAHRLAKHLSQVRAQAVGDSEPSPLYYQRALRDVIGHCLYGVDINPMAAELCRVSLWLEAIEPGKPLSFLDHHIRVGNSLLGATPALLAKGIPDEAFTSIEGDDKEVCKRFKKVNKEERAGFRRLFAATTEPWERLGDLAASMTRLDEAPDDSIEAVREKQRMYEAMVRSGGYLDGQFWADAWCAAFVWKKTEEFNYPITEEVFRRVERNPHAVDSWMRNEIARLAQQYQFFHWHLAYPDVFHMPADTPENEQMGWSGGFDVVLGNPPWDKIQPEEVKFFAAKRPGIADANTAKARKDLILALSETDPQLATSWSSYKREIDAQCHLLRDGKILPLTTDGNLNTYRLFTELAYYITATIGYSGMVVQSGMATQESGKEFFSDALAKGRLIRFLDFENREGFFPDVDSRFRFALITLCGSAGSQIGRRAEFGWLLHDLSELAIPGRIVRLSSRDLELFNPSSKTCPIFTSADDLAISQVIYTNTTHLYLSETDRFGSISFLGELFNLTRDSRFFLDREKNTVPALPLFEAKYLHQFDHRFATVACGDVVDSTELEKQDCHFTVTTARVVGEGEVKRRLRDQRITTRWLSGFRRISSGTNERTAIMAVIPVGAIGNTINLVFGLTAVESGLLVANANSFVFDYCCRQKVSGTDVNIWIFKQLPAVPLAKLQQNCYWADESESVQDWLLIRIIELTYTAWDLQPFAQDCGWPGPPFRWNEERRFLLRCELDAAFFHLYLPSEPNGNWSPRENEAAEDRARLNASFPTPRDAVDYIMETFPIVKRKDEDKWNEYRTKRVVLEIYDAMAEARVTGIPYQTRLSPPPADPSVTHPLPAEMLPRQPQIVPMPLDELNAVADAAWATPVGVAPDNVALFTLIEVMRLLSGPVDSERVYRAANLVRSPAIAAAFMEDAEAAEWTRVVGQDAQPLPANVIQISHFQQGTPDLPWAEAVRQLRGSGAIVVGADGKWSAGSRLPATSKQDWIQGRAAVAVQLLSAIEPAVAERKVLAFIRSVEDGTARRAVS